MEIDLAGLSLNLSALFKRKRPAKGARPGARPEASSETVVQPLVREGARRTIESLLPKFQATASDRVSTRSTDRMATMRSKLRYAFTPSQPVADRRMFAGREETLKTIIQAIEDQRLHVVVYGERGIGKTSLLHMLTQAATEARYIVIYTSCGANSNFDDTIRAVAADIPLLFHRGFAPNTEESEKGATLADLLPPDAVSPRQFADLCAKLTGTRVLVILDEFDRCESADFRRDIAELIKNLSDRLGRVQLVLAGVAADLTQLVAHIPSIRRNILAMRVPRMTDEEVLRVIANGEREVGFAFEPAAGELVTAVSRGSPYIASLLCHHAGQTALEAGRTLVGAADVSAAVEQTCEEFESRIGRSSQIRVQRLIDKGHHEDMARAALARISVDGAFSVQDLQDFNQIDEAAANRALEILLREGLVTAVREDELGKLYEFPEEGLPMYLWIASARKTLHPRGSTVRTARR